MNKREERERKRREALVRAGERQREAIKAAANRRINRSWVEAGGLKESLELDIKPAQQVQKTGPENSTQATETNPALEMIPCPICRVSVRRRNLKKHNKKVHRAKKDGMAAPTRKLGDMTYAERKQHLRRLFGPDDDRKSNDLFDSGRIVSGGAFGLGKSRKH